MVGGMSMGGTPLGAVFVAINANVTGLLAGSQLAKAELGSLARMSGTAQGELRSLGTTATLVGAAVTAMSVGAVMHFGEFEQTMANVGSVLGQTYDEMEDLNDLAREWGQNSVFSAKQVGEAMYYLASAGYDANEVVQALDATLTLAGATMQDLQSTTIMVVAALNAFQLSADQADRVANAMAATISKSQATAEKIGISMRYVAAVANSMGMEVEQVLGSLGLLYNAGLEASQAGTSLRMSLLRLVGTTPKADAALKELGLTAADVDPTLHSLVDIVGKFEKAGLSARQAKDIFGARSVAGMMSLVSAGADSLDEMTESITGTTKASEMLDIQTATLKGSMTKLKNAIGEIVMQFGEALAPVIEIIGQALTTLAVWFGDLPKPIKAVISIAGALAGIITTLIGGFALFMSILPNISIGIATLGTVMNTALGPIGLIAMAITGLIALFGTLAMAAAKSAKKTVDAIEEEAKAMQKIEDKKDALEELAAEYDNLKSKERLTTEEGKRLQEVLQSLSDLAPELVTGYDEFGRVIDIDRQALSGLTAELAQIHNLRAEINRDAWQEELDNIESTRKARRDALNDQLDDEKEAAMEIRRIKLAIAETPEGESTGISITELSAAQQEYDNAREAANALVDEIEDLNVQHERLRKLLMEIQIGEWQGPPVPKDVDPPIDWEAEARIQEDQEERLAALRIANMKSEFEQRRAEAQKAYDDDIALAEASINDSVELRLAAEERLQQELDQIAEDEKEREYAIAMAAVRFRQGKQKQEEENKQARIAALEEELERQKDFYYLDEEAYIEYLMRKREAYAEDAVERQAIDDEIAELAMERAKRVKREWAQTHASISTGFGRAVAGMVVEWDRKTKVFKKIWDSFGKSMTQSFLEKMIRPITDALADFLVWAMKELTKLLLKGLGVNLATGGALSSVKAFKNVANLGFQGMPGWGVGSHQHGGNVRRGGIARVHRGEQIVPYEQSKLLKRFGTGSAMSRWMLERMSRRFGEDIAMPVGRQNEPVWDRLGMTKDDYMTSLALQSSDQIVVAPGGILSTDDDSIDEFFREVWIPAKRRNVEQLRDSWGEEEI